MLPPGAEIRVTGIDPLRSYALVVSVPEETSADNLKALRQGLQDTTDKLHAWWAGEEKFCQIVVRDDLVLRFERTDAPMLNRSSTQLDVFGHPESY